jgi:hypothetical protein
MGVFKTSYIIVGITWAGIAMFGSCKSDQKKTDNASLSTPIVDSTTINEKKLLALYKKEGDAYILPWNVLLRVAFEKKYSEKLSMVADYPLFSDTLKVLDGKQVQVEGFYIPVDETGNEKIVILSAYPFSQCFFCGKAGVESIIDILSVEPLPRLKVDSKIKFKGRLKLNRDNFDYLIYVLEEAVMIDV